MDSDHAWRSVVPGRLKGLLRIEHRYEIPMASEKHKSSSLIHRLFAHHRDKINTDGMSLEQKVTLEKFQRPWKYTMGDLIAMHGYLNHKKIKKTFLINYPQPRRYLYLLVGMPAKDGLHPVTAATNLRKPYKETMQVYTAESFVPADYLLDPNSLHTRAYINSALKGFKL